MQAEEYPKKSDTYYLPADVTEYIEDQARLENRSPSNYLTTLIRRVRDAGKPV